MRAVALTAVVAVVGLGVADAWPTPGRNLEIAPAEQPDSGGDASPWRLIRSPQEPMGGAAVDAVWTGEQMLVWTSERAEVETPPGRPVRTSLVSYSPADERWQLLPSPPVVPAANRNDDVAVWANDEMIVYGNDVDTNRGRLAAYSTSTRRWRLLPEGPDLTNVVASPVWTGEKILVWGGVDHAGPDVAPVGAVFDMASGQWERIPDAPIGPRQWHTTVWTGTEMVIWGGTDLVGADLADGAAFNPATRRWRPLPASPIAGRVHADAVWTGREVVVVGGHAGPSTPVSAAAYNPQSDRWRVLPDMPIGGRYYTDAVWSGGHVVLWGGYDYYGDGGTLGDGAAYSPQHDRWEVLAPAPIGPRCHPQLVASDQHVLVFGGATSCDGAQPTDRSTGAVLDVTSLGG